MTCFCLVPSVRVRRLRRASATSLCQEYRPLRSPTPSLTMSAVVSDMCPPEASPQKAILPVAVFLLDDSSSSPKPKKFLRPRLPTAD